MCVSKKNRRVKKSKLEVSKVVESEISEAESIKVIEDSFEQIDPHQFDIGGGWLDLGDSANLVAESMPDEEAS